MIDIKQFRAGDEVTIKCPIIDIDPSGQRFFPIQISIRGWNDRGSDLGKDRWIETSDVVELFPKPREIAVGDEVKILGFNDDRFTVIGLFEEDAWLRSVDPNGFDRIRKLIGIELAY